ncbi:MAG: sigma-70 family RNA polymerase sigma factor [Planctomycetes bacterium]|nr:sigma-70 family RNA polymerase sigma factor [Planctomycetota bacterium]
MDERQLITACRVMDRSAQRRVYDQTVERVYRLILRMVRNADDAFDLTQEVYVRVFTRIDEFRAESSLATWIHRIAVNEALAFLRRRQTQNRHLNSSPAKDEARSVDLKGQDEQLDVQAALDQLSEEDRLILFLRYDQRHDYRAIGELLECAEGTVASRLSGARQRLKEALTDGYSLTEETRAPAHQNDGSGHLRLTGVDAVDRETQELRAKRRAAGGERP